jgi:hypothetical protein
MFEDFARATFNNVTVPAYVVEVLDAQGRPLARVPLSVS